jgi:ATP-binding cassette subfamily B protein
MVLLRTDPVAVAHEPTAAIQPAPKEAGGWIRRLWPFLAAHKRDAILAFGISVIGVGLVQGSTPWVEKRMIDDVVIAHKEALAPWLTLLVVFGVANFVSGYVRRYFGGRVSLDVQYDLRNAIYERLQRLDFARHDELQTGQIVSRASSDVGLIQGILAFLPVMLGNLVQLVVAFGFMLWFSPLLTLISLVAVPLLFWVALRMRTRIFPATWNDQQLAGEVAGVVDENVTGVRVVKAFGQEDRENGRLTEVARRLFASRVRTVKIQARYTPSLSAIPTLVQVCILALGGWMALHGEITLGTFLAFSTYAIQLVAPVRMFATILAVAQQARAGGERILDILDANPLVVEPPDATELPPVLGLVELSDVRFGYLPDEPVLDGFSLLVRPGEKVALVGASGSGKSTVSLLLPRFYDVSGGAVRIDDHDVRTLTLESLRSQIGVVFEEAFLFSDSVRANIAYGRPNATDAEVVAAAREAEADTFIRALPDGYDTVVGERGLTLSGGQRQRVALARALLTRPQILILDDATSSVDSTTEEEIHATLRRVMEGRTTILVAHRRSTLGLADRIVVVDRGRVVDEGAHEDLARRSALYRDLLGGADDAAPADEFPDLVDDDDDWRPGQITEAAWPEFDPTATEADAVARFSAAPAGAGRPFGGGANRGPGGGGRGGGNGVIGGMALAPTPELLAAVDALPPATAEPKIDAHQLAADDTAFSLSRFTRPFWRPLGLGLSLVMLDALLGLCGPLLVAHGLDDGVEHHAIGAVWLAASLFLAATLVDWVVTWGYTRYTGRAAERLLFALRVRIFAHLERMSVDYYDREMAGRVMTRMTTDVDAFSQLLQSGLLNAITALFQCGGVAVLLGVLDWRLGLATAIVLPPLVIGTLWFRAESGRTYKLARERIATVNANFQESLSGVRVAQANRREQRNIANFQSVSQDFLVARVRAQQLIAIYFPFVVLLSDLAEAAVLGRGSALTLHHQIAVGVVIAFLLYLDQFFSPIQQLSQTFDTYQEAVASGDRINELMGTPTNTPAVDHPIEPPAQLRGEVRFADVHFSYPGAVGEALRGVDFEVEPGETIALVGETGAGKSTIVKLVARFYDASSGHVQVDGIDVADYDLPAFRRKLGIVPQEAFLFAGTVRDNIAYGRPEATDAEVEEAARSVGAHALIAALPGGYRHIVAERGRSLSSGQRQLIALARAKLIDPAVLLLDEATSNLDLATEARVQRAMGVVSSGRTTLLVAHRLPTARTADRILVIDEGRVAEAGSHDDLLRLGGRYAALWAAFTTGGEQGAQAAVG